MLGRTYTQKNWHTGETTPHRKTTNLNSLRNELAHKFFLLQWFRASNHPSTPHKTYFVTKKKVQGVVVDFRISCRENPVAGNKKGLVGVDGVGKTSGGQPNRPLRAHPPPKRLWARKKKRKGLWSIFRLADRPRKTLTGGKDY